jgi:hypothetical protein
MNTTFLIIGAIGFTLTAIVSFVAFHIYSGIHDSLTNARVGRVYNFIYEQPLEGESERYMAKVLDVHILSDQSIKKLNEKSNYRKNDENFKRTNHLITAQTFDGKIRNFYAERTKNVRRPLFGGVVFKTGLANFLF